MDARSLPDLAVFLEVVRCGSITRAAQRLNMVQSNVTARIKKLEQIVAAPLLHRHARGVKPTPAGEAALAMALRVDAVIDDLRFTFGKDSARHSGKLRLGAIETVLASHLPALVANFSRTYPHVDVSVRTGSSVSLLQALRERELDVGYVSRRPSGPGLRHRVAFRDELVVVAPATADEFRTTRWLREGPLLNVLIQRLGCSYTERLLSLLAKSNRRHRLLELGTLDGILAFVEQGLGIAAMPRAFVVSAAARRKVRIVRLPPAVRQLETIIVAPEASDCTFAANAFFAGLAA
jgi:LysR family transcriptional regulator, cell division regulator